MNLQFKKILTMLLTLLCINSFLFTSCKPAPQKTSTDTELESISSIDNVAKFIVKLLQKEAPLVDDIAKAANKASTQIMSGKGSYEKFIDDVANAIADAKIFTGQFGEKFSLLKKLVFKGLKDPLKQISTRQYKAHGWEDDATRKILFAEDTTRGIMLDGSYLAPQHHNAKRLEDVATIKDGDIYLSLNKISEDTLWSLENVIKLFNKGLFETTHEILYTVADDVDGVASIAVAISARDRGPVSTVAGMAGDVRVITGEKVNHPMVVAFLKGGKVQAEDASVYSAGRIILKGEIVELGGKFSEYNPFSKKELFVKVDHFNTDSGHFMEGVNKTSKLRKAFESKFVNKLFKLMGANDIKLIQGIE